MINIGTVDSGGIIAKHIRHLADRTDARIVTLCDVNPVTVKTRQDAFSKERPVNGYATPEAMYAREKLDAVIMTTPIRCITDTRCRPLMRVVMSFLKSR